MKETTKMKSLFNLKARKLKENEEGETNMRHQSNKNVLALRAETVKSNYN